MSQGKPEGPYALLARCLSASNQRFDTLLHLREAMERAFAAGALPFEVISGTPARRYGARITLTLGAQPARVAAAFGLEQHPLGIPTWIGLRVRDGGSVRVKAYHRMGPSQLDESWRQRLPAGLPEGLVPVMAALDGDARELYLRLQPACPWRSFAAVCTDLLGVEHEAFPFAPEPRPEEGAFGVSLRWQQEPLAAVTLYADFRALPDDAGVRESWVPGLDPEDRRAYELALGGVRSLGAAGLRPWHTMLAWTLDVGGDRNHRGHWHRAASLRVPRVLPGP